MNFEWKKEYIIGVKIIDEQHQYFVGLINELYGAIQNGEEDGKLGEVFDKLISYAIYHFRTEEKYFEDFGYEGAAEHKAQHDEIKNRVLELQRRLNEDKLKLSFDLIDFLEDWLVGHLKTTDSKYVNCFKEHGLE